MMKSPNHIAIEALPRYEFTSPTWCGSSLPADRNIDPDGEYVLLADVLAAITPPAQGSIDADGLPPLPDYILAGDIYQTKRVYTSAQMRAYVLADRAARQSAAPTVQGSVDTALAEELKAAPFNLSPHAAYGIAAHIAQRAAVASKSLNAKIADYLIDEMGRNLFGQRVTPQMGVVIKQAMEKCHPLVRATPTAPPAPVQSAAPAPIYQSWNTLRAMRCGWQSSAQPQKLERQAMEIDIDKETQAFEQWFSAGDHNGCGIEIWLAAKRHAAQVAEPSGASVDSPELIALLDAYCQDGTMGYEHHYRKIVAHIDAWHVSRASLDSVARDADN